MHLLVVEYSGEHERKKIDYIVSKYSNKINKPQAQVLWVEDSVVKEVYQELQSKLYPRKIKVYRIRKVKIASNIVSIEIEFEYLGNYSSLEDFVSYLMAKYKGVLRESGDNMKKYIVHSKKGRAEILVNICGTDGNLKITYIIEGVNDVVKWLKTRIESEMKAFIKAATGK